MESCDGLDWEMYKIQHLFRNECCNVLAELFVRGMRNSSFIMDLLERNREDTLSKSLFRLLKNVSSKGKKKAMRKDKVTTEEPQSVASTQHLNNLRDNEAALSSIFVRQLLLDGGEADVAVERLRTLDSAFLLWILTNDILQFNHNSEVKEALDTLREIRNSIHHRDSYKDSSKSVSDMLDMLCAKTKFLCSFLGRDNTSLQNYISHTQSNFYTLFREVQKEIHKSCCDSILPKYSYEHNIVQPFIKHLRGHCQPDEIVENLMEFLAKNRLGVSEEPRPVLLCGAPRVGKSSILNCLLLNNICEEEQSNGGNFPLVVRVDEAETARNRTREMFWNQLLSHLTNLCPQAVHKYGSEEVLTVLSSYSCRTCFLFVVDINLHDTKSLNHLMPYIDRGMWVLSYQGVPEPSSFYHVLKVELLTERQVTRLLREINMPEDKRNHVSELYRMCDYKGLIDTPDMAHLFADVCLEMRDSVPFYKLIETYIYSNINEADEDERELIKLGKEAFKIIKENMKYYTEAFLDNIKSSVWQRFLEQDQSKGLSFKYRVVEDYLAAKYVVVDTENACDSWLEQPTLFKRVFGIVCSLWSKEENGIQTNLPYIRKYLETLFDIVPRKKRRRKKNSQVEPMETDETDFDGCTNQNNFVQWKYLSKLAVDNQNNEYILVLLAGLLACKKSWFFKCKSLTEKGLVNLAFVFRHVNLTKELTIKLESGPNVAMLMKLWGVLSDYPGVCSNTTIQIVIHHTDKNWMMHEKSLAQFSTTLVQTTAPLYITKYVGPLLCSGTEQFLNCLCMRKLDVLDVYVCDLGSLREVLAHRKKLRSIIVRLNLRIEETKIPNAMIELFAYPLNLTITYFEDLQKLLDRIEPPRHLSSLRIYRVYIHKNFSLDLRRFTRLKFLSIKFLHMGTLPSVFLAEPQLEKMEIDDIQDYKKVTTLSLEQWTLQLQLNLRLPESLERLLLRNLTFCDDSNISILNKYWSGLPYQRLVLLDTYLSLSKFKEILRSLVTDYQVEVVSNNIKKCRLEEYTESHITVKQERLGKEEREKRRQNKPEGKEVIITSDVKLCSDCHLLSCSCVKKGINRSQDSYQDFVNLLNDIYSYKILSISYSSRDIVVRKDMCGDLHVQCPLAFLNDDTVQQPELAEGQWATDHQELQELSMVLGALALAQAISLTHTCLSHEGAFCLVQYLKEKKKQFGRIEPFRLTIFSRYYHNCSKSVAEVTHSAFTRKVKSEDCLQQFNFRCDCMKRCHIFKKSINGKIFFNDTLLSKR